MRSARATAAVVMGGMPGARTRQAAGPDRSGSSVPGEARPRGSGRAGRNFPFRRPPVTRDPSFWDTHDFWDIYEPISTVQLAWIIHEARWKGPPVGFLAVIATAAASAMPKARE